MGDLFIYSTRLILSALISIEEVAYISFIVCTPIPVIIIFKEFISRYMVSKFLITFSPDLTKLGFALSNDGHAFLIGKIKTKTFWISQAFVKEDYYGLLIETKRPHDVNESSFPIHQSISKGEKNY